MPSKILSGNVRTGIFEARVSDHSNKWDDYEGTVRSRLMHPFAPGQGRVECRNCRQKQQRCFNHAKIQVACIISAQRDILAHDGIFCHTHKTSYWGPEINGGRELWVHGACTAQCMNSTNEEFLYTNTAAYMEILTGIQWKGNFISEQNI